MRLSAILFGLGLGLAMGWASTGCGSSCSASNCQGCCDSTGTCQTDQANACGAEGGACTPCLIGETCVAGACALPGGSGGTSSTTSTSTSSSGSAASQGGTGASTSGGTQATTGGIGGTTAGTGATTAGSSSSGAACVQETSVSDIRAAAQETQVCATLTVLYGTGFGEAVDGGGTQYSGEWFMFDSTGQTIDVFHNRKAGYAVPDYDPVPGDSVLVDGTFSYYPANDGGGGAQIGGKELNINLVSSGNALPSPVTPSSWAALTDDTPANAYLGQHVTAPAGAYFQNDDPSAFQYETYVDGVTLSGYADGGEGTLYIDTYTFSHGDGTGTNCTPPDGGFPNLRAGGFNGVLDREQTDDLAIHNVLVYDCGE